jgi:hypothetical protein
MQTLPVALWVACIIAAIAVVHSAWGRPVDRRIKNGQPIIRSALSLVWLACVVAGFWRSAPAMGIWAFVSAFIAMVALGGGEYNTVGYYNPVTMEPCNSDGSRKDIFLLMETHGTAKGILLYFYVGISCGWIGYGSYAILMYALGGIFGTESSGCHAP